MGWADGRNIQIDYRWGAGRRRHAQICYRVGCANAGCHLHLGSASMPPLLQGDPQRADSVRFGADPVGAGFVNSLARPGGNATGFISVEYTFGEQMAGAPQRNCAERDACCCHSRSCRSRWHRRVRSSPPRHRLESSVEIRRRTIRDVVESLTNRAMRFTFDVDVILSASERWHQPM